jgi:hypothetical protein
MLLKALQRTTGDRSVAVFEYRLNPKVRYGWGSPPHGGLLSLLAKDEERYRATVRGFFEYEDDIRRIPNGPQPEGMLSWDNAYWGGMDAVAHYSFLCQRRPETYLEVGSGYSTRFARRAVNDHHLPTRIISIDPYPRADIDAICDVVIRKPLEETDITPFSKLKPGDVVVIDGTHTGFMNSDTVVAFLELLPAIPQGVLVCIDDVFLPWDYPPTWAGRWYGEQYLLASMLLAGAIGWSVLFPGWYLTNESAIKTELNPLWRHVMPAAGKVAKSFWLERTMKI